MIKKLFSGIFTITLTILVIALSLLLVVRNIISKDTINDMLNVFATNNNETINTDDITVEEDVSESTVVDTILSDVIDETTIPNEVIEYIEPEEVSEYINQYITQYFEYTIGMAEMPSLDTPEFNELINTGIEKYEQATGNQIEEEEITSIITTIDQTVSEVELPENEYIDKTKQILRVCFDNRTLYIMIGIIVLNIIILIILAGFRSVFKRISIILIIDSILLFASTLLLTFLGQNEVINSIIKILIKNLNTFAYTTFGTGAVMYILLIFIKPKQVKELEVKEVVEEVKEEPEPENKTKVKKETQKK